MTEHFTYAQTCVAGGGVIQGEGLCRQCAAEGNCCCTTEPDNAYLCFPLSLPEWQRLVQHAALATAGEECENDISPVQQADPDMLPEILLKTGDSICVAEKNVSDFTAAMRNLLSGQKGDIDRLWPENGTHLRLRTRKDGSCVFLGEEGCRLPRDVRPWYCLLFPAWMQGTEVTMFLADGCVAAKKARNPLHGLALMGISAAEVRCLFTLLQKDWGILPANGPLGDE